MDLLGGFFGCWVPSFAHHRALFLFHKGPIAGSSAGGAWHSSSEVRGVVGSGRNRHVRLQGAGVLFDAGREDYRNTGHDLPAMAL